MVKYIHFKYGSFKYEEIKINSNFLIKGRFSLRKSPKFPKEFSKPFWFYDLGKRLKRDNIISLGPYYPQSVFNINQIFIENLKYPVFSNIVFNSKSGPLHKEQVNDYIKESRLEQLKIISNFYAHYLKEIIGSLEYSEIVPVPAKPMYSFNSVEIISSEFSNIFKISMNLNRLERIKDENKEYIVNDDNDEFSSKKILLIDDIITEKKTLDNILPKLKEKGCNKIDLITLARTDHNIYEYNE
ncbi:MAG: hypothetical protein GF329_18860 [Candidatus Lokiarchaeota archaeon]|nr:hypothetical protein [Candidatus Lokiarchaeota archaeon]